MQITYNSPINFEKDIQVRKTNTCDQDSVTLLQRQTNRSLEHSYSEV